ncbi:MAG: hypothetical protein Q3974_08425 [Rothia sp. (in: high G+C Gram-positive bacteria)]|nr:hypothetical protein [Rothia sp. (in: high G+C Gram-positive bacteria)]
MRRARAAESAVAIHLSLQPGLLAVYTSLVHPASLLDSTPTILAMRALRAKNEQTVVATVSASDLERNLLQALEHESSDFEIPAAQLQVSWAGQLPPQRGWEAQDGVSAQLLEHAAQSGIEQVAHALPENPGAAVVNTVRSQIWSQPLSDERANIPTGAGFTALVLGFLKSDDDAQLPVYVNGRWTRVVTPGGFVLIKK